MNFRVLIVPYLHDSTVSSIDVKFFSRDTKNWNGLYSVLEKLLLRSLLEGRYLQNFCTQEFSPFRYGKTVIFRVKTLRDALTTALLTEHFYRLFPSVDVRHGELKQCFSQSVSCHLIFEMAHHPLGIWQQLFQLVFFDTELRNSWKVILRGVTILEVSSWSENISRRARSFWRAIAAETAMLLVDSTVNSCMPIHSMMTTWFTYFRELIRIKDKARHVSILYSFSYLQKITGVRKNAFRNEHCATLYE